LSVTDSLHQQYTYFFIFIVMPSDDEQPIAYPDAAAISHAAVAQPKRPAKAALTFSPASLQPEALLEELQMVRLEGRYFCFDKHEASARQGVLYYKDGNRELIIEVSPRFGHPALLAYKVLQAIFKKITDEGRPLTDAITLSQRELARLVGRESFGGRDAQQLYVAISQLRNTNIELQMYDAPREGKPQTFKTWNFSVLSNLGFIGEGQANSPQKIHTAVLKLDPIIAESLRAGHFAVFNWERLAALEPLTATLYKRLYLHFSNLYQNQYQRHNLKFEKDYEDLCAEWLGGLKPKPYKSAVLQQLREHIRALRDCGLISMVSIDRRANGRGFKLVFRPGEGFFSDYEVFYLKGASKNKGQCIQGAAQQTPLLKPSPAPSKPVQLPPISKAAMTANMQPANVPADLHEVMALTSYFYQKLYQDVYGVVQLESVYADRDLAYVRVLCSKFDIAQIRALMDFTLAQAVRTKFQIKNIKACDLYLAQWQAKAQQDRLALAQQSRERDARRAEIRRERLHTQYQDYCEALTTQYLNALSLLDRAAIKQAALQIALTKTPEDSPMHRIMVNTQFKQLVAQKIELPSFETWLAKQEIQPERE
jgi:hypothetical protein